ncbi:MAG: DUF4185 domain-containing protein [Protaetiibacter sp.]
MHKRRSRLLLGVASLAAAALAFASAQVANRAEATTAQSAAVVVSKMTGPNSTSDTPGNWGIYSTDLGVMWDNGSGEILAAFGDTFGNTWAPPGGNGNDWRSQVLLRSNDTNLADGMSFQSAATDVSGHAKELIPSQKIDNVEMTVIPTAGISVGSRQYLAYMSVRHWGVPGSWDTNYAAIAYSDDNGQTWVTTGAPTWTNTGGTNKFQQVAFVRDGGYVYMFGTPNGRTGSAYLARVAETDVLVKASYEYWTGSAWSSTESAAGAVVSAPVAELSVQKNTYSGKWLMTYMQGTDIVLRNATGPTASWSSPEVLASDADYPGLYGGFMHPWSSGSDLYFALSQWDPYNVYLMHVSITTSGTIAYPNLVSDPSFERQTTSSASSPWACTGNCGIDNSIWGVTGDRNGFVRYNSGWHDIHQLVSVAQNTDYRMTGWLRTSSNNDNGFFGVRNVGGAPISEVNFTSVGSWTRYSVTFNSGSLTQVELFTGIWTDNGDMWVQTDDYSLTSY